MPTRKVSPSFPFSPEAAWSGAPRAKLAQEHRILNVPADSFDVRDRIYTPRLAALPPELDGRGRAPTVLDQGQEGACTGYGMAAVVNLLLNRSGTSPSLVSPRFLYENAKRYDEWKGEDYEGSSIRGAMKGFLKHGACLEGDLRFLAASQGRRIDPEVYRKAALRPLGAYFRVPTSSINDLQCALLEVGAVLVSAQVHEGWDAPARKGSGLARIPWNAKQPPDPSGGHAFALVGYTQDGFIVQNSWGKAWGSGGFALLSYADWLANRMDAWVAQIGVGRVEDQVAPTLGRKGMAAAPALDESLIHGHYIAIREGAFDTQGPFRTLPGDLDDMVARIRKHGIDHKGPARLMVYAHGGLVGEGLSAWKTYQYMKWLADRGGTFYPVHFLWHTGFLETLGDLLRGRGGEAAALGLSDAWDRMLEIFGRPLGKAMWTDMKGDARVAVFGRSDDGGPAVELFKRLKAAEVPVEVHLLGHSAGSIFHAHLAEWLAAEGIQVESLTYLAPAVRTDLFGSTVLPSVQQGKIGRFQLVTMADDDEQDDQVGGIYRKSLLYLVSRSFEEHVPTPLLGMARFIDRDKSGSEKDVDPFLKQWLKGKVRFQRPAKLDSTLHGSFDDDPEILESIARFMEGTAPAAVAPGTASASPGPTPSKAGKASSKSGPAPARAGVPPGGPGSVRLSLRDIARATQASTENVEAAWPAILAELERLGMGDLFTQVAAAATVAVETGQFLPIPERGNEAYFIEHYWTNTKVRKRLGNLAVEDAVRFKGRGFIQISGRANYARYGGLLGMDLLGEPDRALEPEAAARILALYFQTHGIPALAQARRWQEVRKAVNGGLNGWERFQGIVTALLQGRV